MGKKDIMTALNRILHSIFRQDEKTLDVKIMTKLALHWGLSMLGG